MTLREKIIEQVGNYEYDGIIDNQEEIITDAILSLFKQATEEAMSIKSHTETIGATDKAIQDIYNKGVDDYHSVLMEKLK